jgi:hypothetical protein
VSFSNSQTLNRYTQPTSISLKKEDINSPFSFKDWFGSHKSIIPSQEYAQYNEYLINWYKEKYSRVNEPSLNIKLRYLSLLRQLQLFLSQEEVENWYNNIDFNNDKELLLATPFFAKKLKDISVYYSRLRETLKESRLRYNQVGTEYGITSQFQKHILTEYTKRSTQGPVLIPATFWNSVPELSTIKDSLVIQLEELYDDHSYLDHSPFVPLSSYYDLNSQDVESFLVTKNLNLSSLNWIYNTGINPLTSFSEEEEEEEILNFYSNLLTRKYLGRDLFTGTSPISVDQKDFYSIPLQEGTNFFYWPSFVYDSKTKELPLYIPQSLSSLDLNTLGTAGSSIDLADTIFIKSTEGITGAWLRSNLFNTSSAQMEALLEASAKTTFRFPFPGFGLSAEDLEWTGFGLTTNKKYRYLKDEIRQGIENLYWSSNIEVSSVVPLKINDTTLVSSKALAGKSLDYSDKLRYFSVAPNFELESAPNLFQESWLYKFTQTDIPIGGGSDNILVWPYERIDIEESFPEYYPTNFSNVCESISISSLNADLAIGSPSLSSSDTIYKIQNYLDTIEEATECCWLKELPSEIPEEEILLNNSGSLQIQVFAGSYVSFVWSGPDYVDADKVFKSVSHSPECLYLNDPTNNYKNYDSCSCRSVLFSPLGHPGEKFSDYESLTDFIVEENNPLEPFDLSTKNTSLSSFGWFKTDSKIGWGEGKWYTNDSSIGNVFYLRKNKKYVYYRTGSKKDDSILPSYTLRYSYPTSPNRTWIRAKKDLEGNWTSTEEPSQMILSPGDLLIYDRKLSTSYILSGVQEEIIDVSENRGSIWTNLDYLTPNKDKPVFVGYPTINYSTNPDPQIPIIPFDNIIQIIQWSLSIPNKPSQIFKSTPSFTFIPTLTGVYTIGLTALSGDPESVVFNVDDETGILSISYAITGIYIFNNIPPITVISPISLVPSYSSVEIPVPGYVLNTPLQGWDYNISAPNPYALISDSGAQPFWTRTYYNANTQFSRYPGIETPQRFFDEHNVITQPEISNIVLEIGSRLDYYRNYPTRINWVQPLTLITSTEDSSWCSLEISTSSSNIQDVLNSYKEELIVKPTTNPSSLFFTNQINNESVEVYYNALNSFVWNITAIPQKNLTTFIEPSTTLAFDAIMPYANLANEHFPTFAAFPTIEDLYSRSQRGGYFIPSNFGASKYLNKNYTLQLNSSSSSLSAYFNETEKIGLTQYLQNSPFEIIIEDSSWLKEPLNTSALAGYLNKSVYKTHQKFIPYQSSTEINVLDQTGIITPQTLQDPWSTEESPKWLDSNNHPISFEGELNISQWTEAQVQFTGLHMDQWVSDIFGNQYGLYKEVGLNASPQEKRETFGQIWVKDNSQKILPAKTALSEVFDTYVGTSLLNELTGMGVKKIDTFFDTLMIETSSILFFEKLGYDFTKDQIYSIADNSRRLSLILAPASFILLEPYLIGGDLAEGFLLQENNLGILIEDTFIDVKFGETWFFPIEKKVIVSIAATYNDIIFPEMYEIDLQSLAFKKIFPLDRNDIIDIVSLSSLEFRQNDRPVLSYNSLLKQYLLAVTYRTRDNQTGFLEFTINNKDVLFLDTIKIFQSIPSEPTLPYISQLLKVFISLSESLNFNVIVDNGPAIFSSITIPSWVSLTPNGLFTGVPPSPGNYFAEFSVTNDAGTSYYSLNIEVT